MSRNTSFKERALIVIMACTLMFTGTSSAMLAEANTGEADPTLPNESANVTDWKVQGDGSDPNTVIQNVYSDNGASLAVPLVMQQSNAKEHGLLGEYYTGTDTFGFGEHKATTVITQINFTNLDPVLQSWTGKQDNANARWSGQIMPPQTDTYTFYMIGDNGFRLWVNDQLVIDHWVDDWDKEQTGIPITLEGGKKYSFKVEYFENYGGSNLYLLWSTPTMAKTIVPADAFYLPQNYIGPVAGTVASDGRSVSLSVYSDMNPLPASLLQHLTLQADGTSIPIQQVEQGSELSTLKLNAASVIKPDQIVNVMYDGAAGLQAADGTVVGSFTFSPVNMSEAEDYSPFAIAMSFYGSPKTNRSFAWYTNYNIPEHAPADSKDSIVEVVPADQEFGSPAVKRYTGKPEDTRVLENLKITNSTNGSFISHKVLVDGLTPGTAYKYRVGNDGNWSAAGTFTTEADNENAYDFLYMTDSQGSNTQEYQTWGNTLKNGLSDYPNAKFLVMTGDEVDAGALESQWLDYFGQAQDKFMKLPVMAAVGNHEGPYNDNYYYHFNYPNDSIDDPLPPGSVYAFDYGDAHIMVLNTMDIGWDDRQKASFDQEIDWLKREVAETDKKWKIVAFHKAIYSLGNHAIDSDILALRSKMYPIFDELGIDVVLQGHDHTFMRSYQMYHDKPVENVEKDADGNALNPDGTLYMINNSAGKKYYDLKDGVDRYYAATYQQPKKPIYSGIRMTEDSFTIDSYISGEEQPFDTYTIVRKDSKPAPVEQLSATISDGKSLLSWHQPQNDQAEDAVRGFRIYETQGKLGKNWSVYVPAVESQESYQYTIEGIDPSKAYEFAVKAVDKRDNSLPVTVSTAVAAPTNPVADDGRNTFGWTNVPGFDDPSSYEYSVDGGSSWMPVTANPQPIGNYDYAAGSVMVRVKGDEAAEAPPGAALASQSAFTADNSLGKYSFTGEMKRGQQLQLDVTVEKLDADYHDGAYAVFELMDGDAPLLISAVPIEQDQMKISQYFHVSGENYKVKVFISDQFNSDLNVQKQLARPLLFQ
ncbi:PA14 domain-containing protein [Paenibacillus hexagrammi]|uniref:PA14 domain-containing protein n=1 Tax=Paenibacillus hexagrammi TaxID=2908839 RepID=A0ABY3SBW1_9BACL|nr:PA14 domain-containing protein [Paenibacillus sp. YPD9-1]UJF31492.1 PA14 domain-containing protein [Paenibacillus sp. YPD9-1]